MRKWLNCLLLLVACTPLLWAQRVPARWLLWKKKPVQHLQGAANATQINISRQLEKRLAQTYQQAKKAQKSLPTDRHIILGEPIKKISQPWELDPQLYSQQTFLQNSQQIGNYLAARNNRLFLQEVRHAQKVLTQIDENLPRLRQEALATQQPADQMAWLAETLPEKTTQFFVGEVHGYTEIQQSVEQLLVHLRTRFAQREIILLTEFLPENFLWKTNARTTQIPPHFHRYFPIWNTALENQIQVVGLELVGAVDDHCSVQYLNSKGKIKKQSVWSSLEGVRLRNEHWKNILLAYRAQHPDALFVIYTGADHSMYNRPFSLADQPVEQTFVAVLYPDKYTYFEPSERFFGASTLVAKSMPGPLERTVEGLDFQRQVIKWQSPDLPAIAGFDARIKVPVQLEDIDY